MYTSLPAATTDDTVSSVPHVELGAELGTDACATAGSKHSHPSATASTLKPASPDRPCITPHRRRTTDAISTRITAPYAPRPRPPTAPAHTSAAHKYAATQRSRSACRASLALITRERP